MKNILLFVVVVRLVVVVVVVVVVMPKKCCFCKQNLDYTYFLILREHLVNGSPL